MKKAIHALAAVALLSGTALASNIEVQEDLIKGSNRYVLIIDSENTVTTTTGAQKKASIIVRCQGKNIDFYLSTPTFNGLRNGSVDVRWSATDIGNQYWNPGTGGDAFFTQTPQKFLDLSSQRDELVLGWEPYGRTQVAAKFDLLKARPDLLMMQQHCSR